MINDVLNGAIILVSIATCLISPITFAKLFPESNGKAKQVDISIIGASDATMLVARDKVEEKAVVRVYSTQSVRGKKAYTFPYIHVNTLSVEDLHARDAFKADKIVIATRNDETNISLGRYAKELGIETVVLRIENASLHDGLAEEGLTVYSMLYSTRVLLKALIDNPGIVRLITTHNTTIREITVNRSNYDETPIATLPFLGEALILHIYRYGNIVVPHGNTTLEDGDILLASGTPEDLQNMQRKLE